MYLPTFKLTSSFLYEIIARKKGIQNICFYRQMTNTKLFKKTGC